MSRTDKKIEKFFTYIVYICGFLLFLEWLYFPINEVVEISYMPIFILFGGFCLLLSMLRVKWWVSALLKGIGIVLIIDKIYLKQFFLSRDWWKIIYNEITFNWSVFLDSSWYNFSSLFRTVLFMIIIWMINFIIYYLFVYIKRPFIFVVFTFIYIGVFDAFTVYDAKHAVIRTFIVGFIVIGIANFMKVNQREVLRIPNFKKGFILLAPIIGIVLFSAVVGYASPKFAPQWEDPFKLVTEITGIHVKGQGPSKTGYGDGDSNLGGSFLFDHTPVFQAITKEKQYWRIESKDVYTGKGWEKSSSGDFIKFTGQSNVGKDVEVVPSEAKVEFYENKGLPKLVYPYGIREVHSEESPVIFTDEITEEIIAHVNGKQKALHRYSVNFDEPQYPINKLNNSEAKVDLNEIEDRYLQLPEQLPERIHHLALEITSEYDNYYHKVVAIENYFNENGFVYETEDVPYPQGNQDYVDQFLFETKKGYCDNFSTSMVVMLRTLDIPARWVKGFSSGEKVDEVTIDGDIENVYEVTNANAHSWVEVYFPEYGWVPFEPTKGFSNPTQFYTDEDVNDEEEMDESINISPEIPELHDPDAPEIDDDLKEVEVGESNEQLTINKFFSKQQVYYIGICLLGFILVTLIMYYRYRFYFQARFIELQWRLRKDGKGFQEAYLHILERLKYHGIDKEPNVTLREFAEQIDWQYGLKSMVLLTNEYERLLYRDEIERHNQEKMIALWKDVIDEF